MNLSKGLDPKDLSRPDHLLSNTQGSVSARGFSFGPKSSGLLSPAHSLVTNKQLQGRDILKKGLLFPTLKNDVVF